MISPDDTRGCEELEAALGALLSGDATREEMIVANRHIAECARCRSEHAGLALFRERLRAGYDLPMATGHSSSLSRVPARLFPRQLWTSVALVASLLVSLVVMRSTPDREMTSAPPATIAMVGEAGQDEADALLQPAPAGGAATDLDIVDELTDEELEELLDAAQLP